MTPLDPVLCNSEYGSTLILGKSGSGKSTALKKILSHLFNKNKKNRKKNLFTVNVRDDFYDSIANVVVRQKVELADLDRLPRNSVIVLEDVISLTGAQEISLRTVLNRTAHHEKQLVFVISHHVYKTSLYNMLIYFNAVVFTSCKSNLPLLKHVMQQFKCEPNSQDHVLRQFQNSRPAKPFDTFYFFSCLDQNVYSVEGIGNLTSCSQIEKISPDSEMSEREPSLRPPPSTSTSSGKRGGSVSAKGKMERLQEKFDKFVSGETNKRQASAVFSIIVGCLPLHLVRETDLALSFRYKSGRERRGTVSLVDYVTTLLDESAPCNKSILFLHRYISKKCNIPNVFLLNSKLVCK